MISSVKIIASVILMLSLTAIASAQAPEVEWETILGDPDHTDYGRGAFQTSDGGYIVGGNCTSWNGGYMDNVLFKLNESGDTLWTAANTTGSYQENAGCFRLMPNGTYMFCGFCNRYPDGSTAYLYNANPDGSYNWMSYFGASDMDESGTCMAQVGTNSYVAMTRLWYDSEHGWDVKMYSFDEFGGNLWIQHYLTPVAEDVACINEVSDGGYIVSGMTQNPENYNYQLLLLKTNASGATEQWATIGGPNDEFGYWVIETADGGFLTTGYKKRDDNYTKDVYIVKTNSACVPEWSKVYGFSYMDAGHYCAQTPDGGYIIGASCRAFTSFDFWVLRLDSNGDTLWTKVIEKPDTDESLYSIDICDDGGYLLSGNISVPGGDCDIYVVKLEAETGVDELSNGLPNRTSIAQNYPNPFNANTVIGFSASSKQNVMIKLYDILGREMRTICNDTFEPGYHKINFDGSLLSTGIYFYTLYVDDITETGRMTLVK